MKKYLTDMTREDFEKVFNDHSEIQNAAYDIAIDLANDDLEYEVISALPKKARYEISSYGRSYIDLYPCVYDEVLEMIETLDRNFCVFQDITEKDRQRYARYSEMILDADFGSINPDYDDYHYCSCWLDDFRKKIEKILTNFAVGFYDLDYSYVMESAYDCEWFSDYYQDENGNIYQERADRLIK